MLILLYHRVVTRDELRRRYIQPGMYVLDDVFERQIRLLRDEFEVLSLADLMRRWDGDGLEEGKRYCVVTFDDGWVDNYAHALPVLKRYGIPATVFLATSLIGTRQWFWPERLLFLLEHAYAGSAGPTEREAARAVLRRSVPGAGGAAGDRGRLRARDLEGTFEPIVEACKKLAQERIDELIDTLSETLQVVVPDERALLNWDEVAQMSEAGILFGSHSCTHRILTTLPGHEVRRELEESRARLSASVRTFVPVFCYPNGDYNQEIRDAVRKSGYEAAVSTRSGLEGGVPGDRFGVRRVSVHNDVASTIPLFALHLMRRTRREV